MVRVFEFKDMQRNIFDIVTEYWYATRFKERNNHCPILLKSVDCNTPTFLGGKNSFNLTVCQSNEFLTLLFNQVTSFELNVRKISLLCHFQTKVNARKYLKYYFTVDDLKYSLIFVHFLLP